MVAFGMWTVIVTYLLGFDGRLGTAGPGRTVEPTLAVGLPAKPSVEINCDQAPSKSVLATIRFRLHRPELDSTRVEFSDSENGFQTGRLVSLLVNRSASRLIRRDGRILRAELQGASIVGDSVVVRLKSLQTGIAYVWRVVEQGTQQVVSSEATRTSAIACP